MTEDQRRIRELEYENAALLDAISALRDFVEGKRQDSQNIAEILNGALRIPKQDLPQQSPNAILDKL